MKIEKRLKYMTSSLFYSLLICSTITLSAQTVEVIGDLKTPYILAHGQVTNDNLYPSGDFEDSDFQSDFTFSGFDHWYNDDNDIAWEGDFYLRTGSIDPFQSRSAFLSLTVPDNHNATLVFAYESEGTGPGKFFFINNVQEFSVGEVDDWTVFEKVLGPGTYNLEWRLSVGAVSASEEFRIDEVQLNITQNHVVRIQDGNEAFGKVLSSDEFGNATWRDNRIVNTNPLDSSGIKIIFESDNPACEYTPTMSDGVGLLVMNASNVGVENRCSYLGFKSTDATNTNFESNGSENGYIANSPTEIGFYSYNSGSGGFRSYSSGSTGFYSSYSGSTGFRSFNSGGDGFVARDSGDDGFFSDNSGGDVFFSLNSGDFGFRSLSDQVGIRVDNPLSGVAADFNGNVDVSGNLSKGGGSFKIDHPLDPENKYLYHSFVESPDMLNIYNGNVTTNEEGLAEVIMPDYFETLNRDFRYQLTVIGTFAQAIIKSELEGNMFVIQTDSPNVKVSWQITGIRQDPYANKNRIPLEEDKVGDEKGKYLHPKAYDMPIEKGIDYINPEEYKKLESERKTNVSTKKD